MIAHIYLFPGRKAPLPPVFGCPLLLEGRFYDCRFASGGLAPGEDALLGVQFLDPQGEAAFAPGTRFELWEGKVIGTGLVMVPFSTVRVVVDIPGK